MSDHIVALTLTAASLGFIHTLIGPDHYLPFIAMGRARGWDRSRTLLVTALCGLGHVLGSVVLGAAGIAAGTTLFRLEAVETFRGDLAAWALIAVGTAYTAWGLHHAVRDRSHSHEHMHVDGTTHQHEHAHREEHTHVHDAGNDITPWVLFTVFVLGPCEPLIPLLMFPAAQHSLLGVVLVAAVFSTATIGTMLGVVYLATAGVERLPLEGLERYGHALAGGVVTLCGVGIVLGL